MTWNHNNTFLRYLSMINTPAVDFIILNKSSVPYIISQKWPPSAELRVNPQQKSSFPHHT